MHDILRERCNPCFGPIAASVCSKKIEFLEGCHNKQAYRQVALYLYFWPIFTGCLSIWWLAKQERQLVLKQVPTG